MNRPDSHSESRTENALMLALFATTLAAIVLLLLVVGLQVHSVVSAVGGALNR